jgi:Tfp pilus assembly protein PilO
MSLWKRIYLERRRVLLPLVLVLAANIAAFLLVVVPLQTNMDTAEADERTATADLANATRVNERATLASKSRVQADAQLKQFYGTILPKDFASAQKTVNLWLTQAAAEAGLSFRSARFTQDDVDDSQLMKATQTMVLQGRYADIRRFLHAVESAEEFIVLERVELAQSDNTQQGRDSNLGVELTVSTYFLGSRP